MIIDQYIQYMTVMDHIGDFNITTFLLHSSVFEAETWKSNSKSSFNTQYCSCLVSTCTYYVYVVVELFTVQVLLTLTRNVNKNNQITLEWAFRYLPSTQQSAVQILFRQMPQNGFLDYVLLPHHDHCILRTFPDRPVLLKLPCETRETNSIAVLLTHTYTVGRVNFQKKLFTTAKIEFLVKK